MNAPPTPPVLPEMRLRSWRRIGSGRLIGVACVDLACGLQISDITVFHTPESGVQAALPDRCVVRGNELVLASDGRPARERSITWASRALREAFSAHLVALIEAKFPGDLGDTEPSGR